jgi:hypothetical protein
MAARIKKGKVDLGPTISTEKVCELFGYKHRDSLNRYRRSGGQMIKGVHYQSHSNGYHVTYFEWPCVNLAQNRSNYQTHLDWITNVLMVPS